MTDDCYLLGIDFFDCLKVIEASGQAPGPGGNRSPGLSVPRFIPVHQFMNTIMEPIVIVGINIVITESSYRIAVLKDIFVFPAVTVGVSRRNLVTRSIGGQFLGCRQKDGRIVGRCVVALEIGSQECRNRPLAIIGNIHQQNQMIILILVETDLDLLSGGQSSECILAFLECFEMKFRGLSGLPTEHLGA